MMPACRAIWSAAVAVVLLLCVNPAWAADYLAEAERLIAQGDLRAAEIELKNAVRDNPGNMAAHYQLAKVELGLGNVAAAEFEARSAQLGGYKPDEVVPLLAETYLAQQKYRELLRDFPGTDGSPVERAGVLVERGLAQLSLGKPDDALASFDEAHTLNPNSPGPLVAKAKLLATQKDVAGAQALIDQALGLAPHDNEARLIKSRFLRFDGKQEEALKLLGEILADNSAYVPARLDRADLLIAQNKDAAAKEDVSAALKVQPRSGLATYLEAILSVKAKDFGAANADLQKISGTIASFPRGYYVLAVVQYNMRQFDQAEDSARRFTARNPDDLAGQKLLGAIELALGHPAEAVSALEKFQSAGNADAGAFDILGRAYLQLGKASEAVAAFDAAAKLAPQDPGLQLRLGVSRLKSGETQKGIDDLEQSLELAPSATAAEILAATELASGHWEEARSAVDKLKKAQPDSPIPDNLEGFIRTADFDLDGARAQFSKIIDAHPDYLPAQLGLVRVLELQGKLTEAEDALNKIVSKNPVSTTILSQLVTLLLRDDKPDAAVAAALHAHTAAPQDQALNVLLINLYIRLGRKDDALALAREETGGNTLADYPLIAARAQAESASGLNNDAAQTLRRLIAIAPKRIDIRRALATLLLAAGDASGARQTITEAMTVDPHNPQLAADLIAIDLKTSGIEVALATAQSLAKSDPALPTGQALEGDVYLEGKQYKEAADAYARALKQASSALLVTRLARAQAAISGPDAAIGILKDWVEGHKDDLAVIDVLSSYEITAGHYDDAVAHLERVTAVDRPNPLSLNNLAWLYQRAGDARALVVAKRAYLLASSVPQVGDTLGWIFVQQDKASSGIGLLEEAAAGSNKDFEIQYHLAVALNATGKREKALTVLKALIADSVTFDDKPAAEKLYAELSGHK